MASLAAAATSLARHISARSDAAARRALTPSHRRRPAHLPHPSLLPSPPRLEPLRAVHDRGREQGPEEEQILRHPASLLQEGARLGVEEVQELSKVLDGFTVADTLVIKAQVQVIHEKPARPFRCLGAAVPPRARPRLPHQRRGHPPALPRGEARDARQAPRRRGQVGGHARVPHLGSRQDAGGARDGKGGRPAQGDREEVFQREGGDEHARDGRAVLRVQSPLDGRRPGALDHAAKNVKPGRSILLSIAQNKVREWRTRSEPGRRASPSREHRSRQSCALLAVRVIAFFVLSVDISVPTREDKRFTPLIRRANESTPDETSGFSPVQPSPPFPPRRVRARG